MSLTLTPAIGLASGRLEKTYGPYWVRPDSTFASPRLAMQAPADKLAYVARAQSPGSSLNDAILVIDLDPHHPAAGGVLDRLSRERRAIPGMLAAPKRLARIRVLVCGVRRLAETEFSGEMPEIAREAAASPDFCNRGMRSISTFLGMIALSRLSKGS